MQKWEYKTVTMAYSDESQLNELGLQGWELVFVAVKVKGNADETTSITVAYLKRPLDASTR